LTHQKPNGAGPQVLGADLNCAESNSSATIGSRKVALGVAQALDETEAEGITCEDDDGDRRRRVPSGQCARWTAGRQDHWHAIGTVWVACSNGATVAGPVAATRTSGASAANSAERRA